MCSSARSAKAARSDNGNHAAAIPNGKVRQLQARSRVKRRAAILTICSRVAGAAAAGAEADGGVIKAMPRRASLFAAFGVARRSSGVARRSSGSCLIAFAIARTKSAAA